MRKIASLLPMLLLLCSFAFGQQTRTITGVVRDDKGNAIPFATITEVGTKNAAQADANGLFSIKIAPQSQLAISAAGFTTATITPVDGQNNVSLVASGAQNLQEVVVTTALGIKKQNREVGYSTATISSKDLNQAKIINPVTGLTGKVSGLQIQTADNSVTPQVRLT